MKGHLRQHQFAQGELVRDRHGRAVVRPGWSRWSSEGQGQFCSLDLPYRVVERAGDVRSARPRAATIEVWRPAMGAYTEISSCSNYADFGGRRLDLRYRPEGGGRPEFCHTLNGSGLAVGRTIIALLENYQEADGTVAIPTALRPYVDGLERLTPRR
jgi:seryl-tRNA synthetase